MKQVAPFLNPGFRIKMTKFVRVKTPLQGFIGPRQVTELTQTDPQAEGVFHNMRIQQQQMQ